MLLRGVLLAVQALQLAGALDLPAGSCTFEESTCGFESVFEFLPWILNEEGHYIYVDTSFAKEGEKAVLLSPDLQAEEWSCLRLVYQITTSSGSLSDPSRLNLYMRFEDENFDRLLWSAKEPSDSWLIASLDLRNSSKKFKILIEGVLGHGNTTGIAVFEIKMTTGYCIGHYMYVDSMYVKHFQEVAQLISPMTTAPMSGCLSFYYQLQQGNDNIFSVYTRDAAGLYEEIWKVGDPGAAGWNLAEVEFSAPYPMQVIFEVAFNGPKGGYVALDDISFSPVHCQNQTERPFSALEASCNFEEDLCNFYQDKEGSGWTRVKVKPNMFQAGDHTSGLGYFLLANTKFTSHPGYIGRLYGPSLPGNLQYCLRFYYAIYGFFKMSDTLAVYIFEENHVVQDKIWSVLESPRGVWMQAEITFKKPMRTKVVFMSLCKSLWDCGLVALDDITIELGSCLSPDKLLPPPGECTFEQDECIFTQERRNRGSWQRRRGETPTSYTGPKGDHTTGVGYYMYIEASHLVYGQKARLSSRPLRGVTGKQCLTFFYHMYGAGTGLLNVYLKKEGDSEESLLWRRRGEQSISWLRALIEYSCERQHQIIFEAIRGMSLRSDTAIDDVKFQAGSCAEMEDQSQQSSGYSEDLNEIEY
ncbi:MAM domain-containing protein 2 isoform 1-T1 [Dama dama]|uniref:MAM domain-containing protein 2 isoform X2 n=1 Tax=Dama dama TaxID=30532 RepID=UPI002A3715B1|nr:MAM domain-containing protein 2 isoform X2 [Dama dama]